VLGLLRTRCALRLRGIPSSGFPDALRTLARAAGFSGPIDFVPIGPPSEMARLAAGADLGLSLEQRHPLNRDLCLTNKIFTYLLAGVPVALTPTSAQVALATELDSAAFLADVGHPSAFATHLDAWLADAPAQASARATAWRLAQSRYNWDRARHDLIASVARALTPPQP
jgi:glycosyltransferase involved in cell wall biosynthesis